MDTHSQWWLKNKIFCFFDFIPKKKTAKQKKCAIKQKQTQTKKMTMKNIKLQNVMFAEEMCLLMLEIKFKSEKKQSNFLNNEWWFERTIKIGLFL